MDIKNKRRDVPEVEGNYPASGKKGHGSAASDNNIGWDLRASSWARGADTDYQAIDAEKRENDLKYGVPCDDNCPAPSDPSGPPNCGAKYQTASYDGNAPLPNPHNWSSNPGFMSVSTADMATSGNPRSGGTATISTPGAGRSLRRRGTGTAGAMSLPAAGSTDSMQDGGPQVITSGYSG